MNMAMRRKKMLEIADDLIRRGGIPIEVKSSRDPDRVLMTYNGKTFLSTHEYMLGTVILKAHEAGIGIPEATSMVLSLHDGDGEWPEDIHVPGYCQDLHGYPWYDHDEAERTTVPDEYAESCIWSWMTVETLMQDECFPAAMHWRRKVLVPQDC